jgi:hypothetical protein
MNTTPTIGDPTSKFSTATIPNPNGVTTSQAKALAGLAQYNRLNRPRVNSQGTYSGRSPFIWASKLEF